MKTVELIPALIRDIPTFMEFEQQPGAREFVDAYDRATHEQCFADSSSIYLRIERAGNLAGFFPLSLEQDDVSVEFRRVVIDEQQRGAGQTAIRLMEQYCAQDLKRQRIWLDVYAANARGRHIYEKLGYTLFTKSSDETVLYYEKNI